MLLFLRYNYFASVIMLADPNSFTWIKTVGRTGNVNKTLHRIIVQTTNRLQINWGVFSNCSLCLLEKHTQALVNIVFIWAIGLRSLRSLLILLSVKLLFIHYLFYLFRLALVQFGQKQKRAASSLFCKCSLKFKFTPLILKKKDGDSFNTLNTFFCIKNSSSSLKGIHEETMC